MRGRIITAATAGGVLIGGWLAGAATAAAAPTAEPSARETIARLQADGHNVIVNKIDNGPIDNCTVTSISSVTARPLPFGTPLYGLLNRQPATTVHVGLRC